MQKTKKKRLLSDEHFTVDGAVIQSYVSLKSFRPKEKTDKAPDNFHGKKRENDTHDSVTDPEGRFRHKDNGEEARSYYIAHVLSENRNGRVCDVELGRRSDHCER